MRSRGKSLSLVPTMGALHEGHMSLIRRAKSQCDGVVVSIFVNPTQFGPGEDFARYPRDLEKDTELLRALNIDVIFVPSDEDVYPPEFDTFVDPGKLAGPLEGAARPGHFRGVATIVLKLFNMVEPDVAYFGQKDFQQVQVIRRLVEDLNLSVRLVVCPILREYDGMAQSSRNTYLDAEGRAAARVLSRCLREGELLVHAGEAEAQILLERMRQAVETEPLVKIEYLAIVNPATLDPVSRVTAGSVALIAARVGNVRLIDNLILGPPDSNPDLLLQLAFVSQPVIQIGARIPGFETEALQRRIESCRDCAAISTVLIPPREYLAKYLKRDYPDLNRVRVLVLGRDAPIDPTHYLYHEPAKHNRFSVALYEMLGIGSFEEFTETFALTDALKCHFISSRVSEKALSNCARHLHDELKHFPALGTIVVLGEDAYQQFQSEILGRHKIKPLDELLQPEGWTEENVRIPSVRQEPFRVIYAYHPTIGYKHSPSLAAALRSLSE